MSRTNAEVVVRKTDRDLHVHEHCGLFFGGNHANVHSAFVILGQIGCHKLQKAFLCVHKVLNDVASFSVKKFTTFFAQQGFLHFLYEQFATKMSEKDLCTSVCAPSGYSRKKCLAHQNVTPYWQIDSSLWSIDFADFTHHMEALSSKHAVWVLLSQIVFRPKHNYFNCQTRLNFSCVAYLTSLTGTVTT